jgi:hypothetical protein
VALAVLVAVVMEQLQVQQEIMELIILAVVAVQQAILEQQQAVMAAQVL